MLSFRATQKPAIATYGTGVREQIIGQNISLTGRKIVIFLQENLAESKNLVLDLPGVATAQKSSQVGIWHARCDGFILLLL